MKYFTADLHFGHAKVARIRFPHLDYKTDESIVAMHDTTIHKQLLETLTRDDEIYILGDISSGSHEEYALDLLDSTRNYTKAKFHLISGNHDSVSSIHRDGWKRMGRFLEVFDSVRDFARIRVTPNGGEREQILLSHYPYASLDRLEYRGASRYLQYRLNDTGGLLIHGHTHQDTPHLSFPRYDLYEREYMVEENAQYCVSWDVSRDLIPETTIQKWVAYHQALPYDD